MWSKKFGKFDWISSKLNSSTVHILQILLLEFTAWDRVWLWIKLEICVFNTGTVIHCSSSWISLKLKNSKQHCAKICRKGQKANMFGGICQFVIGCLINGIFYWFTELIKENQNLITLLFWVITCHTTDAKSLSRVMHELSSFGSTWAKNYYVQRKEVNVIDNFSTRELTHFLYCKIHAWN